jgi:hypothetical protein
MVTQFHKLFFMVVRSSIREELSINSISCPTCGVSVKNRNMSDTVISGRREDENGPLCQSIIGNRGFSVLPRGG